MEEFALPDNQFKGEIRNVELRWGDTAQEIFMEEAAQTTRARLKAQTEKFAYLSAVRLNKAKVKIL